MASPIDFETFLIERNISVTLWWLVWVDFISKRGIVRSWSIAIRWVWRHSPLVLSGEHAVVPIPNYSVRKLDTLCLIHHEKTYTVQALCGVRVQVVGNGWWTESTSPSRFTVCGCKVLIDTESITHHFVSRSVIRFGTSLIGMFIPSIMTVKSGSYQ